MCADVVGDVGQGENPSCTMCFNNDWPETSSTSGISNGRFLEFVFAPCVVVEHIVSSSPNQQPVRPEASQSEVPSFA